MVLFALGKKGRGKDPSDTLKQVEHEGVHSPFLLVISIFAKNSSSGKIPASETEAL